MPNKETGMSLIVKSITRMTAPLILIYGLYIASGSHTRPAGGFAAGVILALSFINLVLAFGKEAVLEKINAQGAMRIASASAVIFLSVTFFGSFRQARHFPQISGYIADIALSIMVAAGLFAVFLALVSLGAEAERR